MNRLSSLILFVIFSASLVWGKNSESSSYQQTLETSARYRYLYMEAVKQQMLDNDMLAMELYKRCLEINPKAAEANYAMGLYYIYSRQNDAALKHLVLASELEPDNVEFAQSLARAYLYYNDTEKACSVLEKLSERHPQNTEYLSQLASIYDNNRDYASLLKVLNKIEVNEGISEQVTLAKMRACSLADDNEGAYRELKGLVDAHPNDMNLQVMMGNWLLNNDQKAKALETYQHVLKVEPDNAQGQMALIDYYRVEGMKEDADKLLYEVLVNPKTDPDTRISLIRDWVGDTEEQGGDSVRVMQLFDKVLAYPQTTSEMAEMKVAYMKLKNAPTDSIKAGWQRVLEITPENVSARLNLIDIMWKDTVDVNVINECKKAVEYVPDEPALYYYLGLAQYLNKLNDEATATFRKGANNITAETSKEVAADLYTILGDSYYKKGMKEEAFVAYDSCLVYKPDNVMCLNNFAYFLSLENRELKKAEKMSYRAITAEPNNGTYLDTYAWILFQQDRYDEARKYIDMAIESYGDSTDVDADILYHAGDIYLKLGMKPKAIEYWEKILQQIQDNPQDNEFDDLDILRKRLRKLKAEK